ncbi:MAG: flagellar biosynthesis anti-sigma factor FlgM [Deltaproteobacteria bacterium]|nr:flagellar biosynthesis anti-sigma factor FlgM [Deltaproteobacteria bacterium]
MKITNSTVSNGVSTLRSEALEKKGATDGSSKNPAAHSSDRVELSVNRAKIEQFTSALASMESTNTGKIESIKSSIADGTYNVSGRAVAEKMLQSIGLLKAGSDENN